MLGYLGSHTVVLVLCCGDIAAYLEVNVTDNVFEEDIDAERWNRYTKTGAVSDVSDYTEGTYNLSFKITQNNHIPS